MRLSLELIYFHLVNDLFVFLINLIRYFIEIGSMLDNYVPQYGNRAKQIVFMHAFIIL